MGGWPETLSQRDKIYELERRIAALESDNRGLAGWVGEANTILTKAIWTAEIAIAPWIWHWLHLAWRAIRDGSAFALLQAFAPLTVAVAVCVWIWRLGKR